MRINKNSVIVTVFIVLFIAGCSSVPERHKSIAPIEFKNSIGMEFVKLPPSQFAMGLSLNGSYSKFIYRHGKNPKHLVTLNKGFYIQTTEVTQEQWLAIMGDNPSYFKNCGKSCPVENISWDDAQKFIKKLNALEKTFKYRLPTEAEWEYACKAGTDTNFYFGDCISADLVNFIGDLQINNCTKGIYRKKTVPVRTFPPNSNCLYEMHGNVAEWCQDSFGRRPEGGVDIVDPIELQETSVKVVRGGSWDSHAKVCLSGYCAFGYRKSRSYLTGFRIARDL